MTYEFDMHFKVQLPTPVLNAFEREKCLNDCRLNSVGGYHASKEAKARHDDIDEALDNAASPYRKEANERWLKVCDAIEDACWQMTHERRTLGDVLKNVFPYPDGRKEVISLLDTVKILKAKSIDAYAAPEGEIDEGVEVELTTDIAEWDRQWNKGGELVAPLPVINETKEVA